LGYHRACFRDQPASQPLDLVTLLKLAIPKTMSPNAKPAGTSQTGNIKGGRKGVKQAK